MRDDLLDARAAVDWADSQIPILQERFMAWQRRRPYKMVVESDPDDARWDLLVAYPNLALDPLIQGDAGAIINSARTALDLLMSTVLVRNGVKPNSEAHFPIRKTAADFLARVAMFEDKKWVSPIEAAAIKRAKAHEGGDCVLYPIHQLDILRKHERPLTVKPVIARANIMAWGGRMESYWRRLNDKTILYRIPKGRFSPTKDNTSVSAEIFLNEPTLGVADKPAILALRVFTARIRAFIEEFS